MAQQLRSKASEATKHGAVRVNGNLDGAWPCATGALVAIAIIAPTTMTASPINRMLPGV
jgi:hypothetical protein